MKKLVIQKVSGEDAEPIVGPLYHSEGNGIEVRPTDLFFVGFVDQDVVASVRFCVEEQTPMLLTMRIAKRVQRNGLGLNMLKVFEEYLNINNIRRTYCLPYAHLEQFYGSIGFRTTPIESAPAFLQQRLRENRKKGYDVICMMRD